MNRPFLVPLKRNYLFSMNWHTDAGEQGTGAVRKRKPSLYMLHLCSCCFPQQLSDRDVLSSWRAQADSIHVLNEHVCLGLLYPLRLLLYLFTHVPLALVYAVRGGEKKREKKSSPCTHSSVLISILSSPLLPPPLVTTSVCC